VREKEKVSRCGSFTGHTSGMGVSSKRRKGGRNGGGRAQYWSGKKKWGDEGWNEREEALNIVYYERKQRKTQKNNDQAKTQVRTQRDEQKSIRHNFGALSSLGALGGGRDCPSELPQGTKKAIRTFAHSKKKGGARRVRWNFGNQKIHPYLKKKTYE